MDNADSRDSDGDGSTDGVDDADGGSTDSAGDACGDICDAEDGGIWKWWRNESVGCLAPEELL